LLLHSPLPTYLLALPTRRSSDLSAPISRSRITATATTAAEAFPIPWMMRRTISGATDGAHRHSREAITCTLTPTSTGARRPYRRSEEHTSELQSRFDLVCRLLLE